MDELGVRKGEDEVQEVGAVLYLLCFGDAELDAMHM
jgi:hypothetical protein